MDEPAPAALRARVAEMTDDAVTARRPLARPARMLVLPVATALAVVIAAVVILVGGGNGSGTPTVPVAARLALAPATLPAPAVDAADRHQLTMTAGGIPFPNWGRVIGARTDRIGGRTITTVYYAARNGVRIGYSVTSGAPLTGSSGPVDSDFRIRYTLGQEGSAPLIAWVRSGHTCVIAGRGATYRTLVALATASVGA